MLEAGVFVELRRDVDISFTIHVFAKSILDKVGQCYMLSLRLVRVLEVRMRDHRRTPFEQHLRVTREIACLP